MKTYLAYGLVWALTGALLTFALFFLGFHSTTEKLQTAQWIGLSGGLLIGAACLVLGTRARRSEVPASEPFGYGSALAAGVMITLFATLFGVVVNYLYMHVINPDMQELAVQAQIEKWEAAGMSSAQMEGAESMMRKIMHPIVQAAFYLFGGLLFGSALALITSAFLRRPAVAESEPPPVS